jgi:hypothetical protein
MGSTVIDRAIVDGLRNRVDAVNRRANGIDSDNRTLRGQLDVMKGFAEQARDQLVKGRLKGTPTLVVTVQGADRKPVEAMREALAVAEATPAGTLLFTNKFRLDNDSDVRALAQAINANTLQGADVVRRQALARLAAVLEGVSAETSLIPALAAAGFVGYEPPSPATTTSTLGLSSFPVAGLRVVLISGAGVEVGDDRLAAPFAQAMVGPGSPTTARLVAAESGQDSPGGRAVFVGLLRADGSLAPKLSTVDNLESPIGQAATILALDDLDVPRTGHFGVGPGAQRLLPPVEP